MDFKIGDDIQEEVKEDKKKKSSGIFNILIIVVSALLVFLLVFLITNKIFNPKDKDKSKENETTTSEKRSLTEDNVKILYKYVTYGTTDIRNDKFVKNKSVKLSDFTDEEICYYALQFAQVDDFDYTGKLDQNNNKIYSFSNRLMKKYAERFFGKNVKYSTDVVINNYPFSFSINNKNVGTLKYNSETASFDTIFTEEEKEDNYLIEPYLGELVEAYKEKDGSYRLIEKVIYIDVKQQSDGKYEVIISKDYDHNNIIESLIDQSENDIKKINISKYKDKAATITYNFKLNGNVLYFDSSEIK